MDAAAAGVAVAAADVVAAADAGRNAVVDWRRQHTAQCCRMDPVAGVGLAAPDAADIDAADGADDGAADWPYQRAAAAAAGAAVGAAAVAAVVNQRQNAGQ